MNSGSRMWLCAGDTGQRRQCINQAVNECAICGSQVCDHHPCPLWRDHYGNEGFRYTVIGQGQSRNNHRGINAGASS